MFDALSESVYTVWIWCLQYTNTHQSSNCNERSFTFLKWKWKYIYIFLPWNSQKDRKTSVCLSGTFRNELLNQCFKYYNLERSQTKICKQRNILQRAHLALPVLWQCLPVVVSLGLLSWISDIWGFPW